MTTQTPDDAVRRSLGFEPAARAAFDEIAATYGLAPAGSDAYNVHYASECLWLVVRHGLLSYELSLGLARRGHDDEQEHPYSLQDAMRVTVPEAAGGYRDFAATSSGAVGRGLRRLAADVETYAEPALRCDEEFFAAMGRQRSIAIEDIGRQTGRASEDASARDAMHHGDWRRVIAIYESRDALSRSEEKRLEIARRRAKPQSS